eukprot:TRINITY_DN2953_c0_g1_i1.p1 TRINITY_DN2953_c0_g1~~TRINITY_DN2953_c0_g1_i1.p1  ORF type:complete len:980 (-),score=305.23 TRINITY_DN2953_c0_g1_i1:24-2963(-)
MEEDEIEYLIEILDVCYSPSPADDERQKANELLRELKEDTHLWQKILPHYAEKDNFCFRLFVLSDLECFLLDPFPFTNMEESKQEEMIELLINIYKTGFVNDTPVSLRNQFGKIFSLLLKVSYPHVWPDIFAVLYEIALTSNDRLYIFLWFLRELDSDVISYDRGRDQSEIARNTLIKSKMKNTEDFALIIDVITTVIDNKLDDDEISPLALHVLADFCGWADSDFILSDTFIQRLMEWIKNPKLMIDVSKIICVLMHKKKDITPQEKFDFITTKASLLDLITSVVEQMNNETFCESYYSCGLLLNQLFIELTALVPELLSSDLVELQENALELLISYMGLEIDFGDFENDGVEEWMSMVRGLHVLLTSFNEYVVNSVKSTDFYLNNVEYFKSFLDNFIVAIIPKLQLPQWYVGADDLKDSEIDRFRTISFVVIEQLFKYMPEYSLIYCKELILSSFENEDDENIQNLRTLESLIQIVTHLRSSISTSDIKRIYASSFIDVCLPCLELFNKQDKLQLINDRFFLDAVVTLISRIICLLNVDTNNVLSQGILDIVQLLIELVISIELESAIRSLLTKLLAKIFASFVQENNFNEDEMSNISEYFIESFIPLIDLTNANEKWLQEIFGILGLNVSFEKNIVEKVNLIFENFFGSFDFDNDEQVDLIGGIVLCYKSFITQLKDLKSVEDSISKLAVYFSELISNLDNNSSYITNLMVFIQYLMKFNDSSIINECVIELFSSILNVELDYQMIIETLRLCSRILTSKESNEQLIKLALSHIIYVLNEILDKKLGQKFQKILDHDSQRLKEVREIVRKCLDLIICGNYLDQYSDDEILELVKVILDSLDYSESVPVVYGQLIRLVYHLLIYFNQKQLNDGLSDELMECMNFIYSDVYNLPFITNTSDFSLIKNFSKLQFVCYQIGDMDYIEALKQLEEVDISTKYLNDLVNVSENNAKNFELPLNHSFNDLVKKYTQWMIQRTQ